MVLKFYRQNKKICYRQLPKICYKVESPSVSRNMLRIFHDFRGKFVYITRNISAPSLNTYRYIMYNHLLVLGMRLYTK